MAWLWISIGLVVLTTGAELLVRGSAWIAEAMGVRHMIVGLTVVAIGTSAPELVVSLIGALDGRTGFALGNVYGSNIANIGLILGSTALLAPVLMKQSKIRFEMVWLMAASFTTLLPFLTGAYDRATGSLMITALIVFLWWLVDRERKSRPPRERGQEERSAKALALHIAFVPAGIAGLVFGGRWLVDGAVEVAKQWQISDDVIAATIIAAGTSLPELATSLVAARKGHAELALGNVIGSNLFNTLMVLGVTSVVQPLSVSWAVDGMRTVFALALTLYLAALLLGRRRLSRRSGGVLLFSYAVYLFLEAT